MKSLIQHPVLQLTLAAITLFSIFFGIQAWMESERQSEWQAQDSAWEARDEANNRRTIELLEEIRETCE